MELLYCDANGTNGNNPELVDVIYRNNTGDLIRAKQSNQLLLSFDRTSIPDDGVTPAILSINSPYMGWASKTISIHLVIGLTSNDVSVGIDATGNGSLEIVSTTHGTIEVSVIGVPTEDCSLEVVDG